MIVMASRQMAVVHSNRNSFGRYRPGMIRKVLASHEYRKTVAPDEATCPSCEYAHVCKENGMVRPSQGYGDLYVDTPFCRQVLDRIASVQQGIGGRPDGREARAC